MDRNYILITVIFYIFFLLLTPLGVFNDWIPPHPYLTKGFYSITITDPGDDTGYYSYLRSAFFDRDWDFLNEKQYSHFERFIPSTGYIFNNWQIGQSILFLPFFLVGHLFALFLNIIDYPVTLDGYSFPYKFATGIASHTYIFIGLILLFKILKQYFRESSALIATLGVWLGSPLLYYTFIRQRMAHGVEFFLGVAFLFYWLRFRSSRENFHHALLGALLGFLCLVRIINVVFLFLYIMDQFIQWRLNKPDKKAISIKYYFNHAIIFSLFLILIFSPQLYTWSNLLGSPLDYISKIISQLQVSKTQENMPIISYLNILMNKVAFFFYEGPWPLIFSAPIWFMGTLGILFYKSEPKEIFPGVIIFLIILFSLIIMVGHSSSYGIRNIIPAAPFFAFGLAAIINRFHRYSICFWTFFGVILFCIFMQYFMIALYKIYLDYNDPHFSYSAWATLYKLIFNIDFDLSAYGKKFFLRSTNFFQLLLLDNAIKRDFTDFLFLIFFPGAQFCCLLLVVWVFSYKDKLLNRFKYFIQPKLLTLTFIFFTLIILFTVRELTPTKTQGEIISRNVHKELMSLGKLKDSTKEYDQAITAYSKAAYLVPENWHTYARLAITYSDKSDFKNASVFFNKALTLNNTNVRLLEAMGRNFIKLKKLEAAEEKLLLALRFDPLSKLACEGLGQLYAYLKMYKKSKKYFKRSVIIDPNFGPGHANLAVLLLGITKDIENGNYHLKKALKLEMGGYLQTLQKVYRNSLSN